MTIDGMPPSRHKMVSHHELPNIASFQDIFFSEGLIRQDLFLLLDANIYFFARDAASPLFPYIIGVLFLNVARCFLSLPEKRSHACFTDRTRHNSLLSLRLSTKHAGSHQKKEAHQASQQASIPPVTVHESPRSRQAIIMPKALIKL